MMLPEFWLYAPRGQSNCPAVIRTAVYTIIRIRAASSCINLKIFRFLSPTVPKPPYSRINALSDIRKRLSELGLELPVAPKPVAAYVPAVRSGDLIFTAGQIPMADGTLLYKGSVPGQVTVEQAQDAARQCVLNGLAVIANELDHDLDRIEQIVRVGVFIASDPGFFDQPKVANGASELLQDIFGDRGKHARAAVGSIALPLGAPVEVEMIVRVK